MKLRFESCFLPQCFLFCFAPAKEKEFFCFEMQMPGHEFSAGPLLTKHKDVFLSVDYLVDQRFCILVQIVLGTYAHMVYSITRGRWRQHVWVTHVASCCSNSVMLSCAVNRSSRVLWLSSVRIAFSSSTNRRDSDTDTSRPWNTEQSSQTWSFDGNLP